MAALEALATATPSNEVRQSDLKGIAEAYLEERAPRYLSYLDLFDATGIEKRTFARPIPYYLASPGWGERAKAFEEVGLELASSVTSSVLDQADLDADAIDGVVLVTTTGLATPSLETHLANACGLRPDILRVPVWGLGCAGGVAGLARTADLARARPSGRFLLVSLELCSLAFLDDELDLKTLVAVALFGDGCAGALVAGDEVEVQGPRIGASRSHLWSGTEDVMGWDVRDEGLGVVFSKEIPAIVEEKLPGALTPLAKEAGLDLARARMPLHPGGPKVLEAYEQGLGVGAERLEHSRHVLQEHGNMSSPTALFALERCLEQAPLGPGEQALLAAVGPGFAAELCVLEGPGA